MTKKALLILADGFEEIEAVAPFDILKRAGVELVICGISEKEVLSARGLRISLGTLLDEVNPDEFDALILPGGSLGAENLSKSEKLRNLIKDMNANGKIVSAICASPVVVLSPTGILTGKKATCYPGMEKDFPEDVKFLDKEVVVDGNVVTGRGPATVYRFGFTLVELLAGREIADSVKKAMLFTN